MPRTVRFWAITGRHRRCGTRCRRLAEIILLIGMLCGPVAEPALAQSAISIPEGTLSEALRQYAIRTNRQILFDPTLVRGKRVGATVASSRWNIGLPHLLRDTGLKAKIVQGGAILIVRAPNSGNGASGPTGRASAALPPPIPRNIIVTAQKRPSVALDTPGTINVVTPEEIESRHLTGLRDLARISPSLSVIDSRNGEQRVAIRGIYGTGEATVGVYFGETPVSGPSGTTLDPSGTTPDIELIDLDRVELLSGPQGTLYGTSSMGGTLRLLFRQPVMDDWSGRVTTGATVARGGSPGGELYAIANAAPVEGKLAARAVFYRTESSGFIDKPALDLTNVGAIRRHGERLIIAWHPSPAFSITATGFSHRLSLDDATSWELGAGDYRNSDPVRTPYSSHLRLGNLTFAGDFDRYSLLATVSHYDWDLLRQSDFTSVLAGQSDSGAGCARLNNLPAGAECDSDQIADYKGFVDSRLPGMLYQPMEVHSTSGEIRLQSRSGGPSEWSVGAFFEDRRDSADSYAVRADRASGMPVRPLDITGLRFIWTTLSQRALFGEFGLALTDRWKVTAGIRHFSYKRKASGRVAVPNIITGTGDIAEGVFAMKQSGNSLKFEISYEPADTLFLYARASEGFRPGGVNITPGLNPDEQAYNSDSLWSYEVGAKMLSPRGSDLELALYHVDWDDMIYYTGSPNSAFFYNANVGGADVDGVEARFNVLLAPLWSVHGRLSYTDARLADSGAFALGAQPGDRLPDMAPLTYTFGTTVKASLGNDISALFQLNANGISGIRSAFNESFSYYEQLDGHLIVDASVTFDRHDWTLGMGVENIFSAIGATRIRSGVSSDREVFGAEPRSFFVRVSRSF